MHQRYKHFLTFTLKVFQTYKTVPGVQIVPFYQSSPDADILHNHSTVVKARKLIFIKQYNYGSYSSFTNCPTNVLFESFFVEPGEYHTSHLLYFLGLI